MMVLPNFNSTIKQFAQINGFVLCGVSRAEHVDERVVAHLNSWIQRGYNANMDWFNRNRELRNDPSLLLDNAKTIVSFAAEYPLVENSNIASYAHNIDYHFSLKKQLSNVVQQLFEHYNIEFEYRIFTDSAPIAERYWAVQAGLGWIGRSGMLINREYGSNILLAEIVCSVESDEYDVSSDFNGCEGCYECVDNCPNSAINRDKTVDATRCLSYLTIEHRGDFTLEQQQMVSRTESLFGCDRCLDSCRWNRQHNRVLPTISIGDEILLSTNSQFKKSYGITPLFHAGLKSIKRNYCAVMHDDSQSTIK